MSKLAICNLQGRDNNITQHHREISYNLGLTAHDHNSINVVNSINKFQQCTSYEHLVKPAPYSQTRCKLSINPLIIPP